MQTTEVGISRPIKTFGKRRNSGICGGQLTEINTATTSPIDLRGVRLGKSPSKHCLMAFRAAINPLELRLKERNGLRKKMKKSLLFVLLFALSALSAFAQTTASTGQITGVVKDPHQAVVADTPVILTNVETKEKITAITNAEGVYQSPALQPGAYVVEVDAKGFKSGVSPELHVAAGQTVNLDFTLTLAGNAETVNVSAGSVENAYRVDNVKPGSPFGTVPIVNLPYSVNVISRQLIDDTQSRNFKEVAKYLPLVSFREQQGPEILRPESRGMQGTNMQNDRKDGMGFAVTTPSALEEYEQIEVLNGLGGPMYGPTQPSGVFNFVTKRPTDEQYREVELDYEGQSVGTAHVDLGGRVGPNHMFGYRTNLLIADGTGYVDDSELRRQLAAVALDARITPHTVVEGNFSYYELFQHGYPGWFVYSPGLTPPSVAGSKSILLPTDAPDPTRRGYGQSFSGVDMNNQIGEVRVKHEFSRNWHLVVGVLNQIADRKIDTAVNKLTDNMGDYQSYLADAFQNNLAPRFQVKSDLAYLTGTFKTGKIGHEVVIGSTGYRFASWQPAVPSPLTSSSPLFLTPLCPAGSPVKKGLPVCSPSIADPLIDVPPALGLPSFAKTGASNGVYVASIIHQQGFNLSDTVTLTPHWLLRVGASQDWTWENFYSASGVTSLTPQGVSSNFSSQGVSPTGSIIFKPRMNMTVYGTYAMSLQAPDTPAVSSSTNIVLNSANALAPYHDKEAEVGYKLVLRKINFSTALFRIERPFENTAPAPAGACGTLKPGQTCTINEIIGTQLNYGAEAMLSGRIIESLMVTGGITVLDPKLTGTPNPATDGKTFVGIPDYKSNILAEYRLPLLTGTFFNFDWQHVGRRPIDDINSSYAPQYNTFDLGLRYTAKVFGKIATWRVTANNVSDVHYWSTINPGSLIGTSAGSYLGHLGEPRLITASMRYDF
jgi:iron complex outermembrane receptor protein